MTFHDFFHDLFKFCKTLGLAGQFQKFKNFPCFTVFLDLKQFNRHKLWHPPRMCAVYALFNIALLYLTLPESCHLQ